MSVGIGEFEAFFGAIYKDNDGKPIEPFPWQSRLARTVFEQGWPKCIDLPTASGKTAAIDVAVFVLAAQADWPKKDKVRNVGRRIFFTVNRRVIVDEAHERALKLAKALLNPTDDIVKRVAQALKEMNGDENGPPLDIAELRGGIYRDRRWSRGITQPMVVATTADQLGSRLLFRGYGVSPGMLPIHAALTACDSTILLDEAHVTQAFSQTLQAIEEYRQNDKTVPPMHFVQMTATPANDVEKFTLNDQDREHLILKARQDAPKPAKLVSLGKAKGEKWIGSFVERAVSALSDQRQAIAVMVNRVQTARDIHDRLQKLLREKLIDADCHLVIGRMRPLDRDKLTESLRSIIGPGRRNILLKPCFVVATQCLEVGADYDFDALVTECASIDALRQRFGRLNRRGRPMESVAAILTSDSALKGDDPVYGDAIKNTWEWLTSGDCTSVDFGVNSFQKLWEKLEREEQMKLLSPKSDAAVLLPAHLDALCQTSPQPVPSPDISYFIHGPRQENAEVQVCWRADLGNKHQEWADIVSLLPPTSPECMTVSIRSFKQWMGGGSIHADVSIDADVAMMVVDLKAEDAFLSRRILIWRGIKERGDPKELCN